MRGMAMGQRKRERQPLMWVTTTDLPTAARHPFYLRLNRLLCKHGFDDFAEAECAEFYAETMGRPSLPPGIYFHEIAWRAADSLALRDFLGLDLHDGNAGLIKGKTIGLDAKTLEANAHCAASCGVTLARATKSF